MKIKTLASSFKQIKGLGACWDYHFRSSLVPLANATEPVIASEGSSDSFGLLSPDSFVSTPGILYHNAKCVQTSFLKTRRVLWDLFAIWGKNNQNILSLCWLLTRIPLSFQKLAKNTCVKNLLLYWGNLVVFENLGVFWINTTQVFRGILVSCPCKNYLSDPNTGLIHSS